MGRVEVDRSFESASAPVDAAFLMKGVACPAAPFFCLERAMSAPASPESPRNSPVPQVTRREVVSVLWSLMRRQLRHFVGCFLLLVASSGLVVLGPVLIKHAIDVDIANKDLAGLQVTVGLFLAVQLAHMMLFYIMRNWLEWAGQRLMADLKRDLFAHLLDLSLGFYDRNPPGSLLSRVENDTEALRMLFTTTAVMLLGDCLLFIGMFVAMFVASPRLAVVTVAGIPLLFGSAWYFQSRAHPFFVRGRTLTAEVCARLAEFIQGMPVIQSFNREGWVLGEFQKVNRERYDVFVRGERLFIGWFNFVVFQESLAFALILGVGGMWALAGLVTIGTLAMFLGYVRRFFEPIFRLSDQFATLQKAIAAAERILLLLREPITIRDPREPVPWPGLGKHITFEKVWFRYREDGEWVLRDVSFTLPAGEHWAVVGATGAGKTTLLSLLLRFYDPTRGRILIDGVDLRDLSQGALRRRVGLVLQDLYLFPGDLMSNLDLGRGLAVDRIREAAARTGADAVIERLPQAYGTELAERGENLSVGERQILAFARAVAGDPDLLLLDEATSSVDPVTEARIQAGLAGLLTGRTALVIAHRLSTIRTSDCILVMDAGRIVESGDHETLLGMNGLYRTLYRLQFKEDARAQIAS